MYDETRAAQHAPRFLARAEAAAKIWVFHTCLLHECAVVREAFTWTGASTRAAATVVVRTCVRACVRVCVHARVSSCVPDAAPIDIGCVSSVEVTLLVYIHVMHMQIDFRWPEELINVTIHMYPYLSKREKKREKEGYRSHLPRTIPMVESHVTFISHNSTWVEVTGKKGRGREREREREREKSRIGGLMWVGRKERERKTRFSA